MLYMYNNVNGFIVVVLVLFLSHILHYKYDFVVASFVFFFVFVFLLLKKYVDLFVLLAR